jgi:S-adenosyl-L-methionine hydrolase (adenosine-forming)
VQNVTLFRKTVSATFQGRDIFAPVAGHVARTGRLADVGPVTDRLALLDLPEAMVASDGRVRGQVLYIDHFGNALTNIRLADLERAARRRSRLAVRVGEYEIGGLRKAYGEVPPGTPVALIGSANTLEIAVNQGSAAKQLGLVAGQEVVVE